MTISVAVMLKDGVELRFECNGWYVAHGLLFMWSERGRSMVPIQDIRFFEDDLKAPPEAKKVH